MSRAVVIAVLLVCCWVMAPGTRAQVPVTQNPKPHNQSAPNISPSAIKPAQQQSNPFPEDTTGVPVLPSANSAGTPAPQPETSNVPMRGDISDPVRSPDDAQPETADSSSSNAGLDQLLQPPPESDKSGKKQRARDEDDGMGHDSAQEDESVGSYYLDQHNWKAALSRYESALVLDPENPDVYWGLAEAQRHLGDYSSAKANYQKVMEYDPDSKRSKEAKKILEQPEMANAKAVSANAFAPASHR